MKYFTHMLLTIIATNAFCAESVITINNATNCSFKKISSSESGYNFSEWQEISPGENKIKYAIVEDVFYPYMDYSFMSSVCEDGYAYWIRIGLSGKSWYVDFEKPAENSTLVLKSADAKSDNYYIEKDDDGSGMNFTIRK